MSNRFEICDIDCNGVDVIKLIEHMLNKTSDSFEIRNYKNGSCEISTRLMAELRNKELELCLKLKYDEKKINIISLCIDQDNEEEVDYTTDLKLYYFENLDVYENIQAVRAENETPKTVRIYKLMYNSHPIYGIYAIKFENCSIKFHTLDKIERFEPLTEYIVAFDVKVKAVTMEDARGKAYNIATDFANYLSVLLDISFYNPQSLYRNFVRLSKDHLAQRIIVSERFRTGFYDKELKLFVKDNLNGIATLKDVEDGISFDSGVVSVSNPDNNDAQFIEKYGNIEHVEKVFESHRLEKVVDESDTMYGEAINEDIFILGNYIYIPKCIRSYYRAIDKLSPSVKKAFRNASRLYNNSVNIEMNNPSFQISLLVASVEALAKQEKMSYSGFINKHNPDAKKSDIDDMYEIRSKLFHSGEFSFFEYAVHMNPYVNPGYNYMQDKYLDYRRILRKTVINWINEIILKHNE